MLFTKDNIAQDLVSWGNVQLGDSGDGTCTKIQLYLYELSKDINI